MRDAVRTTEVLGPSTLVPVYHCGYFGTLSRSLERTEEGLAKDRSTVHTASLLGTPVQVTSTVMAGCSTASPPVGLLER